MGPKRLGLHNPDHQICKLMATSNEARLDGLNKGPVIGSRRASEGICDCLLNHAAMGASLIRERRGQGGDRVELANPRKLSCRLYGRAVCIDAA